MKCQVCRGGRQGGTVFLVKIVGSHGPGKLPEKGKSPRVVRGGCKRSFGLREQKASCTSANYGCTGAKEGLGGGKDSWETFAPWVQQTFCTLP